MRAAGRDAVIVSKARPIRRKEFTERMVSIRTVRPRYSRDNGEDDIVS